LLQVFLVALVVFSPYSLFCLKKNQLFHNSCYHLYDEIKHTKQKHFFAFSVRGGEKTMDLFSKRLARSPNLPSLTLVS